jgi:DnaJ-class molecular chaperone
VRVVIEVPQRLSSRQKQLIEEMGRVLEASNYPLAARLWEKARRFYERAKKCGT